MSFWKRWMSGVTARLDELVSQVENHEALVQSAMAEMRVKTARAKARLERVARDGRELRERGRREREATVTWRERARNCADHPRALECLRRSRHAQAAADAIAQRVAEHERIEAQLRTQLRALEQRVADIQQTHHVMRTRQTRAEALACLEQASTGTDIESVLERWEGSLAEQELLETVGDGEADTFGAEFASAEEKASLVAELAALRGSHE